jgi:hypothetical protein
MYNSNLKFKISDPVAIHKTIMAMKIQDAENRLFQIAQSRKQFKSVGEC